MIGTYIGGVVLIVLSLPEAVGTEAQADELYAGSGPTGADTAVGIGRPVVQSQPNLGFEVELPDVWDMPATKSPAEGTVSYDEGRVRIGIGRGGNLNLCVPECEALVAPDMDALAEAIRPPAGTGGDVGVTSLAGAPATFAINRTTASPSYSVVAVVQGTPMYLWFDRSNPNVELSVVEEIVASFVYARPNDAVKDGGLIRGSGFLELGCRPSGRAVGHRCRRARLAWSPVMTVGDSGHVGGPDSAQGLSHARSNRPRPSKSSSR